MKSKFLDIRNCHSLLPSGHGLSLIQRLENCLQEINDSQEYNGLIDKLIDHNKKTINKSRGSQRMLNAPLDIMQAAYIAERLINTKARVRPPITRSLFILNFETENQATWKIIIPLQYLLKGWGDAKHGYQCYQHVISRNLSHDIKIDQLEERQLADKDDYYYAGITSRDWLTRFSEHMREIRNGSRRTFYRAWRESLGIENVVFNSSLMNVNLTYEEAMSWEEYTVDQIWDSPICLNMIPGGFKGNKFLHKHGITKHENITLEEKNKAIGEYARQNPRKGIPNPAVSELWKNDEYCQRVIEAREKTLSAEQVRKARTLSKEGWAIPEITAEIDALNELQVKRAINRKTYKHIH